MNKIVSEVDILTKYLINKQVKNERIYTIYQHMTDGRIGDKATTLAFRHPRLIPFLDAGLIFTKSPSELRRRIHIVFSTLESTPEYADLFMPQRVSVLGVLLLILVGIRGVFRAIIGLIIVKVLRV